MDTNLNSPRLSVILPVYNAGLYLQEAVASVLNQTYSDFELLCIDDGSTDNSLSILESFSDARLKIVRHPENKGLIQTLNHGIALASGKYIARMDADDICRKDRFEKQITFLETNPETGVLFSRIQLIDHYGNSAGTWKDDEQNLTAEQIRNRMPFLNCVAHPTVMARAAILKKYVYRPEFKGSEDWGLWLELLADNFRLSKLEDVLLQYRIHPSSITSTMNRSSVSSKIIRLKKAYLKTKIYTKSWKPYDWKVVYSLLLNFLLIPRDRIYRPFIDSVRKIIRARPIKLLLTALQVQKEIRRVKDRSHFFFFPFYHVGGAEIVHAAICKTIADQQPVIFFTKISDNRAYWEEFSKYGDCIDIGALCSFPVFRTWMCKKMQQFLITVDRKTLLGCNSEFYYRLINDIKTHHDCIDLIHAFGHPEETGAEHWSLPVVNKLSKRVFISHSAIEQMKAWYLQHGIHPELQNRFIFIANSTHLPEKMKDASQYLEPLQVLYIGRGTPEKRVALVGSIASSVKRIEPEITFTLIGNLKAAVRIKDIPFCAFTGELKSRSEILKYLHQAHVLLLTSSREGMPLVIMEAMAHGVVPISTPVGDIPYYVKNDSTGFLLSGNTEIELTQEAIKRILQLNADRTQLRELASNATQLARDTFSESKFHESYRNLLLKGGSRS